MRKTKTMYSKDSQQRFHEQWLGLAQPIEGLVFSVPVLSDAQLTPESGPELSTRFRHWLGGNEGERPAIDDLQAFFRDFLSYDTPGMLVPREQLPEELYFYAQEGRQEIRPSFALKRGPFDSAEDDLFAGFGDGVGDILPEQTAAGSEDNDAAPYLLLVWDLREDAGSAGLGLSLDKPEDSTGPWRYPPMAKFERLLRHTHYSIGLLSNGQELRLVYAPLGESTSHLTFRFSDMAESAGRPLLAAFELLLSARRAYQAAEAHTLAGLLAESRKRQADVTQELAAQVFEAVELLLAGFEQAALRETRDDRVEWLQEALIESDDHFYQGVLSVVLRLVFLLYAEDQGLMPIGHPFYARHLSIKALYDELVEDAGMHPESMHHRFGAYGRLIALFRAVFLGVEHQDLSLPPRRGRLFDPSSYPFLEGGLPGSTAAIVSPKARSEVQTPLIDDGVIHAVLRRLLLFQGQRLSYRALDVEQIGSVYESLMGYRVIQVESSAVRLGKNRVWAETAWLREQSNTDRKKWLKEQGGLSTAQQKKVEDALKANADDYALQEALLEMAPGGKRDSYRHRASTGKLVLQPGEERRRSGSHYTPRSLTERIVRRTLEPVLACLGDTPTEEQILSLNICDPAMGSGAFLVEACRHLADQLIAIWTREEQVAAIAERYGDPHLHARRLIAQRCLYGVDKNPAAVELAKLSIWLITLSADLPFTFVDHALRHGDSLVGLDLKQITAFHWKPKKQITLFEQTLRDTLNQAMAYRNEIQRLAEHEDVLSQQEKRRLLDFADHEIEKIRLVADVCVGAFFAEGKDKAREAERLRRLDLVERWLSGDESVAAEVRGLAEDIREQHAPFHWWLEFPEVFYEERPDLLSGEKVNGAAYMEAFVGNPPFAGNNTIVEFAGAEYQDWLKRVYEGDRGVRGNCDLSAYFFRRAATLLGENGCLGLVSTNSIAQGDTRSIGLKHLISKDFLEIFDATTSLTWPGAAAVTVAVVHAAKGEPGINTKGNIVLDGCIVPVINSRLKPKLERADARPLAINDGMAYQGVIVLGIGFILTQNEYELLLRKSERNGECIFSYIGGKEINTSPTQDFERYVISFGDMPLKATEEWPDLLGIIQERVKTERDKLPPKNAWNRDVRKRWWQFAAARPQLYTALSPLKKCLVTACGASKHLILSFQPTDRIFANTLLVFPLETYTAFAVLQSRIHEPWARLLSSSMKTDLRYAASDCFDTFAFPKPDPRTIIETVESIGQALYETRAAYMVATNQGLTKTYNALKDPKNNDTEILKLRKLHETMDRAVLDAYGWTDIEVSSFCPQNDAEQAMLTAFEDEVIDRLYVLNAERAREEQRMGLTKKPKSTKKNKKPPQTSRTADHTQISLFAEEHK